MASTASIPQNIDPVVGYQGNQAWATITAANTAKDGTGTVSTVLTATTNGTRFYNLVFRTLGTNVASVARIFINNGSTNATATNNSLIGEISLPATTLTEVAEQDEVSWSRSIPLKNGYKINVVIATAVAAGWQVTGFGEDF